MQAILNVIPEVLVQLTLTLMAVFIVLLVLVQRGRGGGLAGALGGPGGSSAFGAKAGDTFTRITVISATIWIVTCLLASIWAANRGDAFGAGEEAVISETAPADGESEGGTAALVGPESEASAVPAADAETGADTPAE